ncbi:MFS transporter [Bacillus gobiensis]|uniref:MFS transporter n=1 Tax=Bacillus gobiensis TaxID=1441095 RepID=UPI003D25F94A
MSKTWKIYLLALISFLVGTSEFIIAGILDRIAESLNVSVVAAGQFITVFSLAYGFGTPILIALTSNIKRKKLLLYSLGLFVVGNALAYLLPGFGLFIASRIIMALGAGVVVVTSLTVAAKISPAGKQGSAIATVIMGFTASLIIGVPLGRIIASTYEWQAVFGLIGLFGLLAILILNFTIPDIENEEPVPLRKQLALFKEPKTAMALSVTFFWLGGYSIAYTYISPFLLNITGMSEGGLSSALLAFGIASLIGSQFGGYSADKWGIQRTLIGGMLLHILSLILLSISAHSTVLVFLVLILWSFSAWSSGPAQQYNLITLAPEASSIMLSLNSSVMQLSMAAGAGIGGIVVGQITLASITWIGAAGVAIALLVLAVSAGLFHSKYSRKAEEASR